MHIVIKGNDSKKKKLDAIQSLDMEKKTQQNESSNIYLSHIFPLWL